MYRLLALGKYDERYVIPQAHAETGGDLAPRGAVAWTSRSGLLPPPRSRRSTW